MCCTSIGSNIYMSIFSNAYTGCAFQESTMNSSYIAGYGGSRAVERECQYVLKTLLEILSSPSGSILAW